MKSLFSSVKRSVILLLSIAMLTTMSMPLVLAGNASAAITHDSRYNWSGYVATGHTFNKVQGDITVPAITCTVSNAETLFWVGFDGFSDSTVEQAGVDARCVGKTPHYYPFWEMFNAKTSSGIHRITTLSVKPGNRIATVVSYANSKYEMQIVNTTTNKRITPVYQACASGGYACTRNTAEWIADRYVINANTGQDSALAKFGHNSTLFAYAEAATSSNSKLAAISSFNAVALNMVTAKGVTLDTVDSLGGGGTTFGATWHAAQ